MLVPFYARITTVHKHDAFHHHRNARKPERLNEGCPGLKNLGKGRLFQMFLKGTLLHCRWVQTNNERFYLHRDSSNAIANAGAMISLRKLRSYIYTHSSRFNPSNRHSNCSSSGGDVCEASLSLATESSSVILSALGFRSAATQTAATSALLTDPVVLSP